MESHDHQEYRSASPRHGSCSAGTNGSSAQYSETKSGPTDRMNASSPDAGPNVPPVEVPGRPTEQQSKPSSTDRKLAANRLNAQRSTGPRTPEGKQRSKQNSYKTGIFARQLFSQTEEGLKEQDAYKDIVARIYHHYQPQGVIEELLVDKVVTEAVRFARLLWFERQEFARKDAFWGQGSDKVLRYQTAINRQLTKAIEHLEGVQAERKAAAGPSETDACTETDGTVNEVDCMPWETVLEEDGECTAVASTPLSTGQTPTQPPCEAIAVQSCAPAPGALSSKVAESSDAVQQRTENFRTKPPNPHTVGDNAGTSQAKAGQPQSLVEIVERVAVHREPDHSPVPRPTERPASTDTFFEGSSEDDVFNCL